MATTTATSATTTKKTATKKKASEPKAAASDIKTPPVEKPPTAGITTVPLAENEVQESLSLALIQTKALTVVEQTLAKIPTSVKTIALEIKAPVQASWDNLEGRPVSQLATLAAAAKLSTLLIWIIAVCSPGLDVIGNMGVLVFGAVAIYKLGRTGAKNLTAMSTPIIENAPVAPTTKS